MFDKHRRSGSPTRSLVKVCDSRRHRSSSMTLPRVTMGGQLTQGKVTEETLMLLEAGTSW